MTAKTRLEIQGFEYDWIATDVDGHVGFFSTAGAGYAPDEYLRDVDAHAEAIAAILARAPTTDALFVPAVPDPSSWQQMAERGVFAFDNDPNGGPYQLVSAPRNPVLLSELPDLVARVAGGIVLELRFADSRELSDAAVESSVRRA